MNFKNCPTMLLEVLQIGSLLLHALESKIDVLEDLLDGGVVLHARHTVTELNMRHRAQRMSNVARDPIREEFVELLTKIVAGILNVVQNLFDLLHLHQNLMKIRQFCCKFDEF